MNGAQMIAKERRRQIEKEGWTAEHDSKHSPDDLAYAGICYAAVGTRFIRLIFPRLWPWSGEWWKPKDRVRNLVRAGALIAAEIDRIKAAEAKPGDSANE